MFYDPAKTHYFKEMVLTITGQAFDAAGYVLDSDELAQARGLVRFGKPLPELGEQALARVGWQLLAFEQSPFARFRINLSRLNTHQKDVERTLSDVIWNEYEARVLPSAEYWWEFRSSDELPHALSHAGKLLFGYGIPWLEMREEQ